MAFFMGPKSYVDLFRNIVRCSVRGCDSSYRAFMAKKRKTILSPYLLSVIVLIIIIYGTMTPFIGKLSFVDISSTVGRSETLTERTDIWAFLVPLAMKEPMIGHGFGGFWTEEMRWQSSSHAHNGYLDVILDLGFVGLVLFSIFLLSCCVKFQKALLNDYDWGMLGICFLLMAVTHNIAESSIVGLAGGISPVILFLVLSSTKETIFGREGIRAVRIVSK